VPSEPGGSAHHSTGHRTKVIWIGNRAQQSRQTNFRPFPTYMATFIQSNGRGARNGTADGSENGMVYEGGEGRREDVLTSAISWLISIIDNHIAIATCGWGWWLIVEDRAEAKGP
jgi:hypothetical protein